MGENSAAVADLQSGIALARDDGLRDDAEADLRIAAQLATAPSGCAGRRRSAAGFSDRSVTLRFNWAAGGSTVSLQDDHARITERGVSRARGARSFRREVRAGVSGWVVAYHTDGRGI